MSSAAATSRRLPPSPDRTHHASLRRAGAAVALLSTLGGGVAFAHGVARSTSHETFDSAPTPAPRSPAPRGEAVVGAAPPVAHPAPPPVRVQTRVELPPPPATPPPEPPRNRLDEALAALPHEGPREPPPCVKPRRPQVNVTEESTSVWGPDHDQYGELQVRPFHWVWDTSSRAMHPGPPPCPEVRWQRNPAAQHMPVVSAQPVSMGAMTPAHVSSGRRGGSARSR